MCRCAQIRKPVHPVDTEYAAFHHLPDRHHPARLHHVSPVACVQCAEWPDGAGWPRSRIRYIYFVLGGREVGMSNLLFLAAVLWIVGFPGVSHWIGGRSDWLQPEDYEEVLYRVKSWRWKNEASRA